jgi:hypothetical protein
MFPASDANAQAHRAGWLNRIMTTQTQQMQQQQQQQTVPTRRTYTPLRPSAGMVNRIPTPVLSDASPPPQQGSRPSTQSGSRSQPMVPVAQGPNSARAAPPRLPSLAGGDASFQSKQSSQSAHPKKPAKSMSVMSTIAGSERRALSGGADVSGYGASSASNLGSPSRSGAGDPSIHSPLYFSEADAFSAQEQAIVDEINTLRRSPGAYSQVARQHLRVLEPFIAAEEPGVAPMNLGELQAFAADTATKLADAKTRLEALENDEEKDIQSMREAWAAEDAERAKKKGKTPAPKKTGKDDLKASSMAPQTQEEIEADREAGIAALRQHNTVSREETRKLIKQLSLANSRAVQGVKVLSSLVAKLAGTGPLVELERNRGLALAARDIADTEENGSVGVDPQVYTSRYGGGEGPFGQCTALGQLSARETVLDLLLCLTDPGKRRGRHALLGPQMRLVGCGWRRNATHVASTSVVVAGNYAEYAAISTRAHLPLQDIRRSLPFATKISSNTSVRLDVPRTSGIEVLSPESHPVVTTKKYTKFIVKCPADVVICAAVAPIGAKEPTQSSYDAGTTFVQRTIDGHAVEVYASLPGDGRFNVILYGQIPPSQDHNISHFGGTQTNAMLLSSALGGDTSTAVANLTPRGFSGTIGSASVAGGGGSPGGTEGPTMVFRRLGAVAVHVVDSEPQMPPPVFPIASADFHDRRCRIETPMSGALRPDAAYQFKLVVPLTAYKSSEVQRVELALATATRKAEGSMAITERLEAELETAVAAITAADAEAATATPALQNEIATLQKDLAKKKGKELDKAKAAVQEAEEKLQAAERAVAAAKALRLQAEERLSTHRRSAKQAAAMRRRYLSDKAQLEALTDRSKPLDVEMAIDDRRARLTPTAADGTVYEVSLRAPKAGTITVFISGIAVLEYHVEKEALDWPESAFDIA